MVFSGVDRTKPVPLEIAQYACVSEIRERPTYYEEEELTAKQLLFLKFSQWPPGNELGKWEASLYRPQTSAFPIAKLDIQRIYRYKLNATRNTTTLG